MIIPVARPQILDFFGTPLVIEPSSRQLSSAAGTPGLASRREQSQGEPLVRRRMIARNAAWRSGSHSLWSACSRETT
jgi:hypothetical protein